MCSGIQATSSAFGPLRIRLHTCVAHPVTLEVVREVGASLPVVEAQKTGAHRQGAALLVGRPPAHRGVRPMTRFGATLLVVSWPPRAHRPLLRS